MLCASINLTFTRDEAAELHTEQLAVVDLLVLVRGGVWPPAAADHVCTLHRPRHRVWLDSDILHFHGSLLSCVRSMVAAAAQWRK